MIIPTWKGIIVAISAIVIVLFVTWVISVVNNAHYNDNMQKETKPMRETKNKVA